MGGLYVLGGVIAGVCGTLSALLPGNGFGAGLLLAAIIVVIAGALDHYA